MLNSCRFQLFSRRYGLMLLNIRYSQMLAYMKLSTYQIDTPLVYISSIEERADEPKLPT